MSPRARLIAFMATSFAAMGVHVPFWPVWLREHGASPTEIGWLLGATIFARALTPWIAQRVDERGRLRRTALVVAVLCAAVFATFAVTRGFWTWLALSVAFGTCGGMMFLLADTIALEVAGTSYGRLRLWGSAAFLLAAAGSGALLDEHSTSWIYALVLAGLLTNVLTACVLPEPRVTPPPRGPSALRPLRALLADKRFIALALGAGLVQASHAGMYAFGTLYWRRSGIGEGTIGALWAVGVAAEICLFWFGSRALGRAGPLGLVTLGGVAAILRWLLVASTTSVPALFGAQLLHAATFAGTHLGIIAWIGQRLPQHVAVTAMSVYQAIGGGLAMGAATLAAGPLYEALAGHMFLVMAGGALVGSLLVLASRRPGAAQLP